MLDNRLKMCAKLVSGKGIMCDVGTDHALLVADLVTSGKCDRAIASDINEGPLKSAEKTVEKYGISAKVDLVLSDGLQNVCLDGVTDIVIAGMGGETIENILINRIDDLEGINLILQPMTKPEILRKSLVKCGFSITAEYGVREGDKLYTVMTAIFDKSYSDLTEFEAINGFFDSEDEIGKKIRHKESERLLKISKSMKKACRNDEATHYASMATRLVEGVKKVKIYDILSFLDEKYPLSLQESWDNSGYLVESDSEKCSKVLLTLDITNDSVYEADYKGAELVISHHPVIFNPLKKIRRNSPVYKLVRNGIGAYCMHTNLDIAEGGTNSVIVSKIAEKLSISLKTEPLENSGLGYIMTFDEPVECQSFIAILKDIFKVERIKMTCCSCMNLSKIAICSGSGGSLWRLAKSKDCDLLLTGDVKHDIWIDATNEDFDIIDCGHFHTENIVLWELRRVLEEKFPRLDVEIAEATTDPCEYV